MSSLVGPAANVVASAHYHVASTGPLVVAGLASGGDSPFDHAWASILDRLEAMCSLEDDWDGQGSLAPHPALVGSAINLALTLRGQGKRPADFAVVGPEGTIFLEWHDSATFEEIEVVDPGRAIPRRVDRASAATR